MPSRFRATLNTAIAQAVITNVGNNGILKSYDGAPPAGVAAVTGANILLCTHTATGVLGVASSTGVDITEANFANTAASNVGGTTTFVDVCDSAGGVADRVLTPADGWTFAGPVVTGQAVALGALTIPVGNQ